MRNKYEFKRESTATKFAKILKDEYEKESVVEGTSVTVKDECCEKDVVANCCSMDDVHCMMSDLYRDMYREMDVMYRYTREIREEMYDIFYSHMQGHLPNVKDAGKMQEVLTKMGLGESYEVRKPIISVASRGGSRLGLQIDVE